MKSIVVILFFSLSLQCISQNISAEQLLEKAIKYHDPDHKWDNFNSSFTIEMTTPNASVRRSNITIDLLGEYFKVVAKRDTITTSYTITKDKCTMAYNGKLLDSTQALQKEMSCDRANLYKNYYTYLYGLPMKLNDPGTNLSKKVEHKSFKGKDYLVLKVIYDKDVGNDVWYFYFNPKTYAMEIYQFYKTDKSGKEKPDSGEYILLSDEAIVNGIKMPKIRAWYYNKDDSYLGTDTLKQ